MSDAMSTTPPPPPVVTGRGLIKKCLSTYCSLHGEMDMIILNQTSINTYITELVCFQLHTDMQTVKQTFMKTNKL